MLDISEFYAERGGGVRSYVDHKLAYAAQHGHEVVIVAPGPRDCVEERAGGRVRWVASPKLPLDPRYHLLRDEAKVQRAVRAERPDILEGSSSWTAGRFAARAPGSAPRALVFHQDPVAVYPHSLLDRVISPARLDGLSTPYWRYLRRLAQRFDSTVTAGHWLRDRLLGRGVPRVVTVEFGVERRRFLDAQPCVDERARWLTRCGVAPGAKLLVTVSRMHPEKRLGTLLRAVERLRRSVEVGWVVFGDGPLHPWLSHSARHVDGVHLGGQLRDRDSLARALSSADLLLHGSAAETYGLAVAEALCAGLRAVVPSRGGAAELVEGTLGLHYTAGDAVGCAQAAATLLGQDATACRADVRAAALRRVRDIDEHFAALFAHYATLTRTARATARPRAR